MSAPRETEQLSATVMPSVEAGRPADRLEWQGELDSAMAALDSKLLHPRRRASDAGPPPTLPEIGPVNVTQELLDEIAWRVAEQLRRSQPVSVAPPAVSPAELAVLKPAPPVAPVAPPIRAGVAMVIRVRRPLFSWPFKRRRSRRRHWSLLPLSDYRAT